MANDPWREVFAEDCSRPMLCPVKTYKIPESGLEPWVSEFDPVRGKHPEPKPKPKPKGLFPEPKPKKQGESKVFGEYSAWAKKALIIDKLTGKTVGKADSIAAAARMIGMSGGGASCQALNGTFGKGWYAVRYADSPDLPYPEGNRPLILDDGEIKVAFANKKVAAEALFIDRAKLKNPSVMYEGRECTITEATGFMDESEVRRYK